MRRRITQAIVGVAAIILLALGIPLAIVFRQSFVDAELLENQAAATKTVAEIKLPIDVAALNRLHLEPDAPPPFSVYNNGGVRIFGDGPPVADSLVRRAVLGVTVSSADNEIIVVTPIIDRDAERVVGAVRVTESLADVERRTRVAFIIMGASGAAALAIGWLVARRLAAKLSRPVSELATSVSTLGDGPSPAVEPSGIAEIDALAAALQLASQRVHQSLVRERRFSADVSHQLRTPLTGLRLRLETMVSRGGKNVFGGVLDDLTRLESTVEHLLAHARDDMPTASGVSVDQCVSDAVARWVERAGAVNRAMSIVGLRGQFALCARSSVTQIFDVLLDNALRHGSGRIELNVRVLGPAVAIDVTDEGVGIASDESDRIFRRGVGSGTGIGLALARSIAVAEGGRLVLSSHAPTTFSLILLGDRRQEIGGPGASRKSSIVH